MEHGETIIHQLEQEDIDCTACKQVLGSNPYCSNCRNYMSPDQIQSAIARINVDGEQTRKRLPKKPKTRR